MARYDRSARFAPDRTNLYDEITQQFIRELEQGRVPWVQPWGKLFDSVGDIKWAKGKRSASDRPDHCFPALAAAAL